MSIVYISPAYLFLLIPYVIASGPNEQQQSADEEYECHCYEPVARPQQSDDIEVKVFIRPYAHVEHKVADEQLEQELHEVERRAE